MPEPIHPDAPKQAVVSATLTFGLVNVPVKLYTATEDTRLVDKHQFVKGTDNPVGQKNYDKTTDAIITKDQIVTKVDVNGTLIELTDDEVTLVTSAHGVDRGGVEILGLVPVDALTTRYVVSKLYQVRAGDKADKPFALLMTALRELNVGALIRIPVKSYPRYAVVTGNGLCHMLFFDGEVREARPMPTSDVPEKELTMATTLLTTLLDEGTPELVNECGVAIDEYLATKAKDGTAPVIQLAPAPAATVDLTAALEASLASLKAA